jgi:hypothetical protein
MSRQVIEPQTLEEVAVVPFENPVRLVFTNPKRGGPTVAAIRQALAPKGKLRLSGTPARVFADLDPGSSEPLLIALDTIVRSDAAGLERMLLSVLGHVDEIVLGVDARSDEETLAVAWAYADTVHRFDAPNLGLSSADWDANKIDFAAARNIGRAKVKSRWCLVIDSDEYLDHAEDLRAVAAKADPNIGGFKISLRMGQFEMTDDVQRFALTQHVWTSSTHNQLRYTHPIGVADALVVCDGSLRSAERTAERNLQRDKGIENLIEEAAQGNIIALFHLAKHRAGVGDVAEAVKLAEDYRLRIEPHSILSEERVWVALTLAFRYYNEDNLPEADRWAVRALLDGPCMAAFCLLGDIAEDQGDLQRAKGWYEAACAITTVSRIGWPGLTELREGRLVGIRRALNGSPPATDV